MEHGIPLSTSDSATISKKKKNRRATYKIQMKKHCLSLKAKDDALFRIGSKSPAFVLNPLKTMLKLVVDIITLQQLEYEMYRSDPSNYLKTLKSYIVVTLNSLTQKIQHEQSQ